MKEITVALVGNPNSGKTTIFNNLTGARQKVANYPGVTIEKKAGVANYRGVRIHFVDLPGTYSLTAYSTEELITRNSILDERPDVVLDIVDVSNLERNLYLTCQLIELGSPLVLAFNMADVAEARGERINTEHLSGMLGAPIVPTVGNRGVGMGELLDAILDMAEKKEAYRPRKVELGREIEEEIATLSDVVERECRLQEKYPVRWAAIKLLEADKDFRETLDCDAALQAARRSRKHLHTVFGESPEIIISERRYGFISGACQESIQSTVELRHNLSDRIDAIVTYPGVGMLIFLGLMYLVFNIIFTVGDPLTGLIETLFAWAGAQLSAVLPAGPVRSVIVDGIVAGVGGVLVFLPNIMLLFLAIAAIEDSGYMARAAFIMDRLMHRIGLHGKSFIPMVLGFGCSVPGILATRILDNRRDRLVTMLVVPLMSCSARLPVYILLAGAFFGAPEGAERGGHEGKVIFSLYVLGILLAIGMAKLFRKYILVGPPSPLVMELPPYRLPTLKGVLIHTWERSWMYIRKAGTVILALAVVMWFLSTFPKSPELTQEYDAQIEAAEAAGQTARVEELRGELGTKRLRATYAGRLGGLIAPALSPLGFGDWKIATSLVAGFGAKEVVVSTLGTLYSLGEDGDEEALEKALKKDELLGPLNAYALMVFVLIYIPCLPTVAVVWRESRSIRWPLFLIGYTTALAWLVSFVVYQGGRLVGLG